MFGLGSHVLNTIIDIVGDVAVVRVVQDHQAREQHRVLQPVHRQGHEVVSFSLVMQDERQQGHHQHEDDRAADDGVCDAGVVHELVLRGHKHLPAARLWENQEKREEEGMLQRALLRF